MTIESFSGEYYFLSNFDYPGPHNWKHPLFERLMSPSTVEHAYQASKTTSKNHARDILQTYTPGSAKRLGRRKDLPMRQDWEWVKDEIMLELVRSKFGSEGYGHQAAREKLLATEGELLIEGNDWHDNYWGNCTCERDKCMDVIGQNKLGMILMQVRSELS